MLLRMKDFESVIPDAAAKYIMSRSGTAVDDDICYRMLAISAQKFASDILSDAFNIVSFIPPNCLVFKHEIFFRLVHAVLVKLIELRRKPNTCLLMNSSRKFYLNMVFDLLVITKIN